MRDAVDRAACIPYEVAGTNTCAEHSRRVCNLSPKRRTHVGNVSDWNTTLEADRLDHTAHGWAMGWRLSRPHLSTAREGFTPQVVSA